MSGHIFIKIAGRCPLVLAMLFCTLPAVGRKQGQELIDSLLKALPAVRVDTQRIMLLSHIGNQYSTIDPDVGIRYATQGLSLAAAQKWNPGIATACNILGICEVYKTDYVKALQYWERALGIYKQTGDKQGELKIVGNIGVLHTNQGEYAKALDSYFEALKSAEDLNDQNSIAINSGNIGATYNYLRNDKKSLEYYEKAVALFMSLGDKQSAAIFLGNMGSVYREQKSYAQAIQYTDSALKLSEAIGDNENIIRSVLDIGKVYDAEHDYAQALDYFYKALELEGKSTFKTLRANTLSHISQVFIKVAKDTAQYRTYMARIVTSHPGLPASRSALLHDAISYLRQSIAIDSGSSSLDLLQGDFAYLSEAQALSGQYQDALTAYKQAVELQDSIFSTESKLKITGLESQRELALKDKQIEIDRLEVAKKRNERVLFGAGFVLLLIVVVIVIRNIRLSTAKELSENKLNAFQARMNPHFIFNSLSSIQSLILNNETEQSIDYLSEFSILMRQILDNSGQSKVTLQTEIDMLRSYIELEHLRFDGFQRTITIADNVKPESVDVPGMVIQPFVENAILHGLISKGDEGRLDITLGRDDKHIICTVEDNGVGRERSAEINAKRRKGRQSHGTAIAINRLLLLADKKRGLTNEVIYIDKMEEGKAAGTKVIIQLPIL